MKIILNIKSYHLFCCLLFAISGSKAQQQWKFHLAFEDATGVKGTIWYIRDTNATYPGIDTALGEGVVNINYDEFNVWTYEWSELHPNYTFDTTKVAAHPYTVRGFENDIFTINAVLPVLISWDTSLLTPSWMPDSLQFETAYLYNDHIFFYAGNYINQVFWMFYDNDLLSPEPGCPHPFCWEVGFHFPLWTVFDIEHYVKTDNKYKGNIITYPNPTSSFLNIESDEKIEYIQILDVNSRQISQTTDTENINISTLKAGIYFIYLFAHKNKIYYEKFVKN